MAPVGPLIGRMELPHTVSTFLTVSNIHRGVAVDLGRALALQVSALVPPPPLSRFWLVFQQAASFFIESLSLLWDQGKPWNHRMVVKDDPFH